MKISKVSCAICILTFCASFIPALAQDNPAQAAARAALEQKFQFLTPPPAAPAAPGQPPMLSDPQPAATVQPPSGLAPAEADSAAAAKARAQADANKQAKAAKQKAAAEAKQKRIDAEKAASTAASGNVSGTKTGLKPIASPALPISAAKQARLDVLLEQYRADKISPAEYQKQRAEILAGAD